MTQITPFTPRNGGGKGWALKFERDMEKVMKEALTEVFTTTPVIPGVTRGGTRQRGTIPYDSRVLAESLRSRTPRRTRYGSTSWQAVINNMRAGDTIDFTWGAGPRRVDYVRFVHDGANGVPGTFWILIMQQKMPWAIDAAMERLK